MTVTDDQIRDALRAAYIAGASDVVTYGKPERYTDDFGEAAADYAASICATLPAQSVRPASDMAREAGTFADGMRAARMIAAEITKHGNDYISQRVYDGISALLSNPSPAAEGGVE